MACVGGFVVPVPKDKLDAYKEMSRAVQAKEDEVVIFAWMVHPSRDARNAKSMEDPRMKPWENAIPFDGKRMIFGGFKPFQGL